MNSRPVGGSLLSYLGPPVAAAVLLALAMTFALTLWTGWLNGFSRYRDLAILWLYLQPPPLAAALVGGPLVGLGQRLWDRLRKTSSPVLTRITDCIAMAAGGLVLFVLFAKARASWWYADLYPWVDSWGDLVPILVGSSLLMIVAALLAFVLVRRIVAALLGRVPGEPQRLCWRLSAAALLGGHLLLLAGAAGTGGSAPGAAAPPTLPPRAETVERLVLVGLDGATWKVLDPLLAGGELPNFRALIERGASGPLRTLSPTNSPVLWTSIATGVGRDKHGVMNFMVQHPRGLSQPVGTFPSHLGLNTQLILSKIYGRGLVPAYPVTGDFRRAAAVWDVASAMGYTVGVVNWWPSWPAQRLRGFMVSNRLDEYLRRRVGVAADGGKGGGSTDGLAEPVEITTEVAARITSSPWTGFHDPEWMALSIDLFREYRPDLLLIYLPGPDGRQHTSWDAFEPRWFRPGDPADLEKRAQDIPDVYRRADRLLGKLLEEVGKESTVLIVSDHGASPVARLRLPQGWSAGHEHAPPGIFIAAGPGVRRVAEPVNASILDVAPTILALLGLPSAADLDGRTLSEILEPRYARQDREEVASWSFLVAGERHHRDTELGEDEEEALRALGYIQ